MKRFVLLIGLIAGMGAVLFAQEKPRLAVVAFSTNVSTDKAKADVITVRNLVESRMVATGKYEVMTRDEIDVLLENQRIQVSSIASKENLTKLELAQIKYIITGSVDAMGDDYAVTVRVLDVSSGQYPHSEPSLIGGGSRDLFSGITDLMAKFVAGMSADESGAIVQGQARRTQSNTGISIEVSTKDGGILYLQNEEIAALWDNDTHTIPIERPGTYTLKMVFSNGAEATRSVAIASRGVTKIDFTYYVGATGPAGGIIFYAKGSVSDGWQFLEAAPAGTEFTAQWGAYERNVSGTSTSIGTGRRNTQVIADYLKGIGESGKAAQQCVQLNIGGFNDWFLPSKDELDLMYKNLKQKGLGGFSNNWYWSSSQYTNDTAWIQRFSDGYQNNHYKNSTFSVRAVRAF